MTLFLQQFRANLTGLLVWIGIGAALALSVTSAAPVSAQSSVMGSYVAKLPEKIQVMFGVTPGLSSLDQYIALKFAQSGTLMLVLYATMLALGAVTREVDRRTIDFLLSLPVGRTQVLLSRVAVMVLNTGLMALAFWLILRFHLPAMGFEGSWGGYGMMLLNQWLLALAIGGLVLLVSLRIDDYGFAVKLFLGVVAGIYFLEMMFRAAGLTRAQRLLSPFSYVDAGAVVRDAAVPTLDWVVLIIVAVGAVAMSVSSFERKQITV